MLRKSVKEFFKLFKIISGNLMALLSLPEVCTTSAPLNFVKRLEFGKGKLLRDCGRTTAP